MLGSDRPRVYQLRGLLPEIEREVWLEWVGEQQVVSAPRAVVAAAALARNATASTPCAGIRLPVLSQVPQMVASGSTASAWTGRRRRPKGFGVGEFSGNVKAEMRRDREEANAEARKRAKAEEARRATLHPEERVAEDQERAAEAARQAVIDAATKVAKAAMWKEHSRIMAERAQLKEQLEREPEKDARKAIRARRKELEEKRRALLRNGP